MKAILLNLNDEYSQINSLLNFNVNAARDLMLSLVENMLYWDSAWSSAKKSSEVLIDDFNCTYEESNILTNVIYKMHCKIDESTKYVRDKEWMIFNVTETLVSEEFLSISILCSGDYRIEQWHRDHQNELTRNGSVKNSSRGRRSPEIIPTPNREIRRRRSTLPSMQSFSVNREGDSGVYGTIREIERTESQKRVKQRLKND